MATASKITVEQMRCILSEVSEALESPEYAGRLDEAKEAAGNEMLKMMQVVFPMVVMVQMEVLKRHGLAEGREGLVQFSQQLREMEREDSEVGRLHARVRRHYLPPVSISSAVDTSL